LFRHKDVELVEKDIEPLDAAATTNLVIKELEDRVRGLEEEKNRLTNDNRRLAEQDHVICLRGGMDEHGLERIVYCIDFHEIT
jgi:archaellum component FlaC